MSWGSVSRQLRTKRKPRCRIAPRLTQAWCLETHHWRIQFSHVKITVHRRPWDMIKSMGKAPLLIRLRFACRVEIVQGVWPGVDDSRGTADCQWKLTNGDRRQPVSRLPASQQQWKPPQWDQCPSFQQNRVRQHSEDTTLLLLCNYGIVSGFLQLMNTPPDGQLSDPRKKQTSQSLRRKIFPMIAIINHHLQSNNHIR